MDDIGPFAFPTRLPITEKVWLNLLDLTLSTNTAVWLAEKNLLNSSGVTTPSEFLSIEENLPEVEQLNYSILAYKGGQSVWQYITKKYGREKHLANKFINQRLTKESLNYKDFYKGLYNEKKEKNKNSS